MKIAIAMEPKFMNQHKIKKSFSLPYFYSISKTIDTVNPLVVRTLLSQIKINPLPPITYHRDRGNI